LGNAKHPYFQRPDHDSDCLAAEIALKAGDILDFDEKAPFLKAVKQVDEKRMRSMLGCAKKKFGGKSVKQWLDELRGPVELP